MAAAFRREVDAEGWGGSYGVTVLRTRLNSAFFIAFRLVITVTDSLRNAGCCRFRLF